MIKKTLPSGPISLHAGLAGAVGRERRDSILRKPGREESVPSFSVDPFRKQSENPRSFRGPRRATDQPGARHRRGGDLLADVLLGLAS